MKNCIWKCNPSQLRWLLSGSPREGRAPISLVPCGSWTPQMMWLSSGPGVLEQLDVSCLYNSEFLTLSSQFLKKYSSPANPRARGPCLE
mmetsp:Transcript_3368/g.6024  ORF Transcript_3368/g.6024 Transcript_3368/m.6024 type:complete len:89 (-) Transcript_3368:376-642(-)